MKTVLFVVAAVGCSLVGSSADYTDYVYLKKSDPAATAATPTDYGSSFMTNVVASGYGWSNGLDPDPHYDYVVKGANWLSTPYTSRDDPGSDRYVFAGNSLVIDANANRGIYCQTFHPASAEFKNLVLRGGTWGVGQYTDLQRDIYGKIKFDTKDNLNGTGCFTIAAGTHGTQWNFHADTSATEESVCTTEMPTENRTKCYRLNFFGDTSDYLGVLELNWLFEANVANRRFGGTIVANAGGKIVMTNDVAISKVVLRGVSDRIGGTNIVHVGYDNITGREIETSAGIENLILSNGVVCVYENSTLTVGNLEFAAVGGTGGIELRAGACVFVTNSIRAVSRVRIIPQSGLAGAVPVLKMPLSAGELHADDYAVTYENGSANGAYRFSVKEEQDLQVLYCENLKPWPATSANYYKASSHYVYQTYGRVSGIWAANKTVMDPFTWTGDDTEGVKSAFSDGELPHPGADYFSDTGIWIYSDNNLEFGGRSLTLGHCDFRVSFGASLTFGDLRVLGGVSGSGPKYYSNNGGRIQNLYGKMTVLCGKDEYPFGFVGGTTNPDTVNVYMKLIGDERSALRVQSDGDPGAVENKVNFIGDTTEYHGTVLVGANSLVSIGDCDFPGTISLQSSYSRLRLAATKADARVSLGAVSVAASTSVEVPEGKLLSVARTLELSGALQKKGAGTLAVKSASSTGDDAGLSVAEGGVKILSGRALSGIAFSMSAGSNLVLDWTPVDSEMELNGVDLTKCTAIDVAGAVTVCFDNVPELESGKEYVKAVCSVPAASADVIANQLKIARIAGQPRPEVVKKTSDDGKSVVLCARFANRGLVLVVQ